MFELINVLKYNIDHENQRQIQRQTSMDMRSMYMYGRGIDCASVSTFFRLEFGSVLTAWYLVFLIDYIGNLYIVLFLSHSGIYYYLF